jgi:hypothetical protein
MKLTSIAWQSHNQQLWTLVEGSNLFTDNKGGRRRSRMSHLARMISLLGPPPKDLLDTWRESTPAYKWVFDKDGERSLSSLPWSSAFSRHLPLCYPLIMFAAEHALFPLISNGSFTDNHYYSRTVQKEPSHC